MFPNDTVAGGIGVDVIHDIRPMIKKFLDGGLDILRDLLGGWWMAVPKKRRSKARRGQRNAPKYIR